MIHPSPASIDGRALARLEQAADVLEIREVLARYCRGIDRGDLDLVLSCFHEDAVEDHGHFKGACADFYRIVIERLADRMTSVNISNVSVEFSGTDRALSEAYHFDILREGPMDTVFAGRYLDRFERRKGCWRIANRVATADWWTRVPVNSLPLHDNLDPSVLNRGRRGRADPYYSARSLFLGT
jgi:hypothetical protein